MREKTEAEILDEILEERKGDTGFLSGEDLKREALKLFELNKDQIRKILDEEEAEADKITEYVEIKTAIKAFENAWDISDYVEGTAYREKQEKAARESFYTMLESKIEIRSDD